MRAQRRTSQGFTLMEVLVAVAIFVIVGALAMGGYNELVKQSDMVETNAKRTRSVQRTVNPSTGRPGGPPVPQALAVCLSQRLSVGTTANPVFA